MMPTLQSTQPPLKEYSRSLWSNLNCWIFLPSACIFCNYLLCICVCVNIQQTHPGLSPDWNPQRALGSQLNCQFLETGPSLSYLLDKLMVECVSGIKSKCLSLAQASSTVHTPSLLQTCSSAGKTPNMLYESQYQDRTFPNASSSQRNLTASAPTNALSLRFQLWASLSWKRVSQCTFEYKSSTKVTIKNT